MRDGMEMQHTSAYVSIRKLTQHTPADALFPLRMEMHSSLFTLHWSPSTQRLLRISASDNQLSSESREQSAQLLERCKLLELVAEGSLRPHTLVA
jgi:hypothetical protein